MPEPAIFLLDAPALRAGGYCKLNGVTTLSPAAECTFNAVILGTQIVKQARGKKSFTTYKIFVTHSNGETWSTLRRYSEFFTLKEQIKSNFPDIRTKAKFPPKQIFKNMTPETIDLRRSQLQSWFRAILAVPSVSNSSFVEQFIAEIKFESDPGDIVEDSNGDKYTKLSLGKLGFLFQLSSRGVFKRSWCVLRNNVLYKYKSHTEKHPFDQLAFITCIVTEAELQIPDPELDLFCFMVVTPRKKYIFACQTEEEREDWVCALAEATFDLDDA